LETEAEGGQGRKGKEKGRCKIERHENEKEGDLFKNQDSSFH